MQIVVIPDFQKAMEKTKEILYEKVDKKTFFILAGGNTPRYLYSQLAKEEIIKPAAVGIIDERFGEPFHENSNELMVKESGLLDYFNKKNIPFYSMLQKGKTPEEDAKLYDKIMRDMFFKLPKNLLLLGLGPDGHIASIMPNRKDFTDPLFDESQEHLYVSQLTDPKKYKTRITLTFAGLSLIDQFVMIAFGKEKKKALQEMFTPGSVEELPARFLTQHASNNTVIITDQQI